MTRPEIIIASIMRPSGNTGVQTHVSTFQRYLRRAGVSHALVTPFSGPAFATYPVFAVRRAIDPLSGAASVWWYRRWHAHFLKNALAHALADGQPTIIYAQCPPSAEAALRARTSRRQKVVLVAHFNGSQALEWAEKGRIRRGGRLFQAIERLEERVLAQVDAVTFVSEYSKREITRRLRQPPPNIAVSPNFVDDRHSAEAVPTDLSLLNIGTLEPRKNQGYLIDILAELRRVGHDARLTLVGDGPDREMLSQHIARLGLTAAVTLRGFVPNALSLLATHRIYVHAARMESQGIVLIEAMSASRPVFAPRVGGIPELFSDGVEGRFIPLDAAGEAAAAILDAVRDPEALTRMGQRGRERFASCYSTDVVAPQLLTFLREA